MYHLTHITHLTHSYDKKIQFIEMYGSNVHWINFISSRKVNSIDDSRKLNSIRWCLERTSYTRTRTQVHPTANAGRLRGSHAIRLWDVQTKSLVASLIVDEDSQRDDFGYAFESLTDSVVLRKNRNYVITSEEQSGSGDLWCDQGPRARASLNAPIKILHDCSGVSGSVFPNQGSKNTSKAAMGVPILFTFPIISSCSNFPSFETCTSSSRFSGGRNRFISVLLIHYSYYIYWCLG